MSRIGFVLEGGGLLGAYQCGAMRALDEKGIRPSVIAGTSIGALNGALVSLGKLDRLVELYENFEATNFFELAPDVVEALELDTDMKRQIPQITRAVLTLMRQGGIDIGPLQELIRKEITEEKLRSSDIELGIVTLEIPKIRPVEVYVKDIPQGQVHDYLLASAYLPFFKAQERRFIDGGLVDNVPMDLLLSKGPFDEIYVIRSHSGVIKRSAWYRPGVTLISPSRRVGRSFNLDQEKIRDNLRMGYFDTLKILQGYVGNHFTFKNLPDNLMELLIEDELMESLYQRFSVGDDYDHRRYFYEELMPGLARALGLGVESNYQGIILESLEAGGRYLGIDPNKLYELDEYLKLLRKGLDGLDFDWSLKEKVSVGVAKYTRGWLGDLENFILAFLDLLVKS